MVLCTLHLNRKNLKFLFLPDKGILASWTSMMQSAIPTERCICRMPFTMCPGNLHHMETEREPAITFAQDRNLHLIVQKDIDICLVRAYKCILSFIRLWYILRMLIFGGCFISQQCATLPKSRAGFGKAHCSWSTFWTISAHKRMKGGVVDVNWILWIKMI